MSIENDGSELGDRRLGNIIISTSKIYSHFPGVDEDSSSGQMIDRHISVRICTKPIWLLIVT